MTGKPKRLIACVFAVVPIVPLVMAGLGLATGPSRRSQSPADHVSLVPVQPPAPAMPIPAPAMPMPAPAMPMPAPAMQPPALLPRNEPLMAVNQAIPQGISGLYPPLAAWPAQVPTPPAMSSLTEMLPFQEAHWQGLEAIPLTGGLKKVLKILSDARGVIIDDVTAPADLQGFLAGDLITSVGQIPTPDLESFLQAADRVRSRRRTEVQLLRKSVPHSLVLTAMQQRLGTANGETAPMIKPGSRPPHGYLGACTNCHRIGTTGQLALDQGDLLSRTAPPIRAGQAPPHRDRGACTACHTMVP